LILFNSRVSETLSRRKPMSTTQRLVRNVLDTRFEDFDRETVAQAKMRIIDTVGATVSGADAPGCSMVLDVVREWGGKPESTIPVYGDRVPAANAALVTAIMARSWDIEPAGGAEIEGRICPGHYSATTVPVAFAVAEQRGIGGRELISALILGDDLACRIGSASGNLMRAGWEPSGFTSRFAAAAIAGRMMGLNEKQLLHALGIVLNQISGTMQTVFDGTHCFKMNQGIAAWNGIFSAELARRGFTGPKDPLLGKFGYFDMYCQDTEPDILTKDLGKKFYADGEYKIYPCCRGTHAAIESTLKLVQENNLGPEDIDEVTVMVPTAQRDSFLAQPFEIGDVPQANAGFNFHYTVANAALRKSVTLEHFTEEAIREPKVIDFVRRVKIDASLPGRSLSAGVRIKTKNGQEFSATTEFPRGTLGHNPLTEAEINDKFLANVAFAKAISREKAAKALHLLAKLEELDTITEVMELLKRG
jgi:2-methylcitrate dehydratase PrpD